MYTSKECWGCILLKSVGVYTSKGHQGVHTSNVIQEGDVLF